MDRRVEIQKVSPSVDCGRYAAKAVVGDDVTVRADLLREGHDKLAAAVRYRGPSDRRWREAPLRLDTNDRWYGHFRVDEIGSWRYVVVGWTDHYATWLDGIQKKHAAGQTDLAIEIEDGALLLQRRRAPKAAKAALDETVALLRSEVSLEEKVAAAGDPGLLAVLDRHPERLDLTSSREFPLWADRERARFSAWYEMFPRSEGAILPSGGVAEGRPDPPSGGAVGGRPDPPSGGAVGGRPDPPSGGAVGGRPDPPSGGAAEVPGARSGTFADAAKRLPAIAEMGFDVVYLPPIHPIGRTNRKGTRGPYDLEPGPDAPGVPWAIGSEEGGHTAVHPDLGTLADFDDFVAEAGRLGLEVALDYAIQCSPDHPWVTEHPEWFKQRSDGSIAYAENPPKKYQDIYPINFDTPDIEGLCAELKRVFEFWIDRGIKIFRVDNPHTKALPFWEWVIAELRREHPDLIFLAEAFTRPKMMRTLAKLGFNQSYTYFAWRNTKEELTDYLTELAHGEMAQYYRPNFWPNTPDILTEFLQHGGRPAFKLRLVLAALLSPSYGIYSGYELVENRPLAAGSEEYFESEKYRYKPRDWERADSLAPYIARVNRIRAEHAAFRFLSNVRFHDIDNPNILCFSKTAPGRTEPVLVVVNLDPYQAHEGTTGLDLWQLGLEHVGPFEAHDLLTDTTYIWHGPHNYVRLDPHVEPSHVLRLRAL